MSELIDVSLAIGGIIAVAIGIGVFTKLNIDRKNKPHKKLSKKQKRELSQGLWDEKKPK